MRRVCHSPAAIGVLLLLSVLVNLVYIYKNDYNVRLVDQLQGSLAILEIEERNKLVKTASSDTGTTIPDGFAISNPLYWKYFKRLFIDKPYTSPKEEQFTIVMMTYKRSSILRKLIPHYCSTGRYLNKFILIWNEVGGIIPKDILHHECSVPFVVKLPAENKLINRFYPYSDIKTDGEVTTTNTVLCF